MPKIPRNASDKCPVDPEHKCVYALNCRQDDANNVENECMKAGGTRKIHAEMKKGTGWLGAPDKVVDNIPVELKTAIRTRSDIRSKIEELRPESAERRTLNAMQNTIKMIVNTSYGYVEKAVALRCTGSECPRDWIVGPMCATIKCENLEKQVIS